MKKLVFTLLVLCGCGVLFGQGKIDENLLQELHQQDRTAKHKVMVVMAEEYDVVAATANWVYLTKEQRRASVMIEKQRFNKASQQEVMHLLEEAESKGKVSDLHSFWVFNGFSCETDADMIELLANRNDIAWIYSDKTRRLLPEGEEARPVEVRGNAWHVDKVNAPEVWNYNGGNGYTGQGVIVAVLDTGVNYNHLDIANSMWDGGEEFPHHGYDVINHDNDPMDDHGHGSHCAGIVAGQGTSGTQTGIAPNAKIMAVKVMSEGGEGGDQQLFDGVEFALEHGADIISCSFGDVGTGGVGVYRQVYETILQAGVVAAVAAGNDGQTQYAAPVPYNIESPGNCPPPWLHPDQKRLIEGGLTSVICVGATDTNDGHCSFSSVGPATWAEGEHIGDYNDYPYENGNANKPGLIRPDISAPGANITSLNYATNNGYIEYDGTSMATPCVAGVLALLLEADSSLTPAQLDSIIELTAVKIGNVKKNNIVGSGRIDALAAVKALFFHGPTNLSLTNDEGLVNLQWDAAPSAVNYLVFRDGLQIANTQSSTTYTDHLSYAGGYSYYVIAEFEDGSYSLPSNYVFFDIPVAIETEVINNSRVALSWNQPEALFEDFESGNLYQHMWINDANKPWEVTTSTAHSGSYCVKSTNEGMFTSSKISLAVNVPITCALSYWAHISCFPLNGGALYIDNVQYGETIKDIVPWTQYTVTLSPGNHILEWRYVNQLGEGDYDNAFYIDDVSVGNLFTVYRAKCDGSDMEQVANNLAVAEFVDYGWEALPDGWYKYGVSSDEGTTIAWTDCIQKDLTGVEETVELSNIKRITILNTLGQVVYDAPADADISAQVLKRHPSGVYLVNILTDKGVVTMKVGNIK